jgi:hypothetical protein
MPKPPAILDIGYIVDIVKKLVMVGIYMHQELFLSKQGNVVTLMGIWALTV